MLPGTWVVCQPSCVIVAMAADIGPVTLLQMLRVWLRRLFVVVGHTLEMRSRSWLLALVQIFIQELSCLLGMLVPGSGGVFLCLPFANDVRMRMVVQVPAVNFPVDLAKLPLQDLTTDGAMSITVCP